MSTAHPSYGLDAPGAIAQALIGGAVAVGVGLASRRRWLVVPGAIAIGYATVHTLFSTRLKPRLLDRLVNEASISGDEAVLDIGCGRGRLLVNAAHRLSTGVAVGVDVWSTRDQSGNDPAATMANLRAEGVSSRAHLITGTALHLPFPDQSFDRVVSSLVFHNIAGSNAREQAIEEVARVLRPGGRAAILDLAHTAAYDRVLVRCGLATCRRGLFGLPLPAGTVVATKEPSASSSE